MLLNDLGDTKTELLVFYEESEVRLLMRCYFKLSELIGYWIYFMISKVNLGFCKVLFCFGS